MISVDFKFSVKAYIFAEAASESFAAIAHIDQDDGCFSNASARNAELDFKTQL